MFPFQYFNALVEIDKLTKKKGNEGQKRWETLESDDDEKH